MRISSVAGGSLGRKMLFLVLFSGLMLAGLIWKPAGHSLVKAVDDVAGTVGPLIGALWCFRGVWDAHKGGKSPEIAAIRGRRIAAAIFLGLGVLGYALGMAIWDYYELILHRDSPFPSWADAAFLSAYPCLLLGVLLLPSRPLPLALRGRVFLDGLMTMTALVTFSWYFTLGPTLLKGSETLWGKILGAGYPVGDLVILFCLLVLTANPAEIALRRVVSKLSLGMISVVIVDTLYCYDTLHGTYQTGRIYDAVWPFGYMLIGLAASALLSVRAPAPATWDVGDANTTAALRNPILWRSLVPYALVPAVGALLIYAMMHHGDENLEPGVYIGSTLLIGLILIRQVFAILENNNLNRYLRETYRELESKNRSLFEANIRLESLATTDGMTGLANHRVFQERLRAELANVRRHNAPLALLLLDVDRFKYYNDMFGHPAGDEVLKTVARLLRDAVRETDLAARYGGEEFAVLLPGADPRQAQNVAERIRAAVAGHAFAHRQVTVSVGVTHNLFAGDDPEALIASADTALYAAKHSGRNRFTLAESALSVQSAA